MRDLYNCVYFILFRVFRHVRAFLCAFYGICPRPSGDVVSKATIRYPPSKDQLIGAQEGRLQRMSRALAHKKVAYIMKTSEIIYIINDIYIYIHH